MPMDASFNGAMKVLFRMWKGAEGSSSRRTPSQLPAGALRQVSLTEAESGPNRVEDQSSHTSEPETLKSAALSSCPSRKLLASASSSLPLSSPVPLETPQARLQHSISGPDEDRYVGPQQPKLARSSQLQSVHRVVALQQEESALRCGVQSAPYSDATKASLGEAPVWSCSSDFPGNDVSGPTPANGPAGALGTASSRPSISGHSSSCFSAEQGPLSLRSLDGTVPEIPSQPPKTKKKKKTTVLALSQGAPASMRHRQWCLEDFEVCRKLYKGNKSAVYKAICRRSGLLVALKVYFPSRIPSNVIHAIVRETKIQAELVHNNIVMLYAAFKVKKRLVLVQEFAARGDLYGIHRAMNRRMTEAQLTTLVLAPFLDALTYLHSKGICHRDIKPENILFTQDWRLLVADFGVSIDLNKERAVTRAGTLNYMAPEVERCPLKMRPEDNKKNEDIAYTTAVDIWATGVLAYELLVGFPPFVSDNSPGALGNAFLAAHATCKTLSFPASTSAQARDFISLALAERPEERPTALQLSRHPWLLSPAQR